MFPPQMNESLGSTLLDPTQEMQDPMIPAEPDTQIQSSQFTQDEIDKVFQDLLLSARDEDRFIRQSYVSLWRRLEYYWNNILDIFLDPITKEWRIPDWSEIEDEIPPRLINIYRPHGEAIVAALSVSVPSVIFHPDDADNPDDVDAAKAYRSIVDLLALHNEAPMMFIRVITIFFNQGTVFGYNYYHQDPKYGTLSKPKVEFKDIDLFEAYCPQCGEGLDAGVAPSGINPSQPGQEPQLNQSPANQQSYQCQTCGYQGPAHIIQNQESLPQIVGYDDSPKGSISQKLFSGLQVKVPMYAGVQEECGYLLLEFVQSVAMLRSIFKDNEKVNGIRGKRYQKELNQFLKLPLQYTDQMPDNAANVSCIWLRPYQFYDLDMSRKDMIEHLVSLYPTGCYALFIDDELFEVVEESMDAHWTISKNPFSSSIHSRPMGENLATIQDIRAQFTEIEIQTVEHGIPETFADPAVLDFKKYGEGRAKPGMMTQAKPKPGKSISDGFFSTKPATLSQEVAPLRASLDEDAQFVTGSFPSIYGGQTQGGSKTASEYSQSRAMALQRIGTMWKIACSFWSQFQSRSAVEFAEALKELGQDERFTRREGKNNFVNVWIRNSALTGRIGKVEPESTEQLPTSWAQKKDAIAQLMTSGVQEIIQVLTHPNNAELMQEIIGVPEFYIPGEEDRDRQRKEFVILSQGIQVPTNLYDNDDIHAEILKSILEGPLSDGLPQEAMQACLMHLQEHQQKSAQAMMAQQQTQQSPNQNSKPNSQPQEGQQ